MGKTVRVLGLRNERAMRWAAAVWLCAAMSGCAAPSMDWIHGGETLMPQYRTVSHEMDYKSEGLPPPPMGFRWYHVDMQYVLANRTTGLILKSVPAQAN